MIQLASDAGNPAGLVFFLFDLLYLDGEDLCPRPLFERKTRLATLLANVGSALQYSEPARARPRVLREGLLAVGRGHRLEARRCPLRARQPRLVAQGQMSAPRG